MADELDSLYAEKKELEAKGLLEAIGRSSKTKAEILAFLESVRMATPSFAVVNDGAFG